jgi:Na+-driven multidrug efflux pump
LKEAARPYFAIAIPGIATQASPPVGQWMLTLTMAPFGPEAVAAMAVSMRLMMLVFGGIYGLSGAIGGIIGQNFGAGRMDRVRRAYLDSLIFCTIYTLAAWLLLIGLTEPLIRAFNLTGEGVLVMRSFTYWVSLSFLLNGVLFVAGAAFNNLGKPIWATVASWLRDIVLVYPFAWVMGTYLGGAGAMLGYGMAAVVAGAVAGVAAWRLIRRLQAGMPDMPVTTPAAQ